jgi:phosphatidylglycerol:prolipoprotein diacylglycerol transferase
MFIYNTFAVLGCLTGMVLFARECRRAELWLGHAVALPVLAFLVSRFGARVLFAVETGEWGGAWTGSAIFSRGGLSLLGGLYVGVFVAWIYAGAMGIRGLYMLDLLAVPLAGAFTVGRLGCFFAGCCRGPELPEGWMLPSFIPQPHLFPSPLVGSFLNLLIVGVLFYIPVDKANPGRRAAWFFILYGVARIGVEFVRTNRIIWAGLTIVHIFSIPLIVVGLLILWWTKRPVFSVGASDAIHTTPRSPRQS